MDCKYVIFNVLIACIAVAGVTGQSPAAAPTATPTTPSPPTTTSPTASPPTKPTTHAPVASTPPPSVSATPPATFPVAATPPPVASTPAPAGPGGSCAFPSTPLAEGNCANISNINTDCIVRRSGFPTDFRFGASTSAYQIEGAYNKDGKGPSVQDYFPPKKGRVDTRNGVNSYYMYKKDIKTLNFAGLNSYRFSISWPRILPDGTVEGGVNPKGIKYYNNLIDGLLKKGITPFVTLFHLDLPMKLQQKYDGVSSSRFLKDFRAYCEICFRNFGDRVKHWITINEPFVIARFDKKSQNSLTVPYIIAHNLILAHGAVARMYKEKFQVTQHGIIGISLVSRWYQPYSNSSTNIKAAERAMDFHFGWFMDPFTYGNYPSWMISLVKDRLPNFNEKEKQMVMGSLDFVGINYYFASCAKDTSINVMNVDAGNDAHFIEEKTDINNVKIEEYNHIDDMLVYIKNKYQNPQIYITENGMGHDERFVSKDAIIHDQDRIVFLQRHLYYVREAIMLGVDVKGYFHWSLMDNVQGNLGYNVRMGLYYVDHKNNYSRRPKDSVNWLRIFLKEDSNSTKNS